MAKGPEAFRTISEAADELHVPQHVLRFWETRFTFIKPMKRAGGRRFYRPSDIAVLAGVRRLLHDEGYTIKGVQKLHREQGIKRLAAAGEGVVPPLAAPPQVKGDTSALLAALHDLETAKARLDGLLAGVRRLLHDEGYTIKGVQKLHREQGIKRLAAAGEGVVPGVETPPARGDTSTLLEALHGLETAKARLDGLLRN